MARGKKAETELTPEEKLEQALVSVGEQPYAVPENWCWTTLDRVSIVVTGGTPNKKNLNIMEMNFLFLNRQI